MTLVIKGQPQEVEFKAAGWEQVLRDWKRSNPVPAPPWTEEVVKPGSPEARRLGHTKGMATRKVYDERDYGYLEALSDWNDRSNYMLAAHCLKVRLTSRGQEVTDLDGRANALKSLGLTSWQAAELFGAVMKMSRLADAEAVDFFGMPSGSAG